jgi:outer membrane lipoprotein-sorting protein
MKITLITCLLIVMCLPATAQEPPPDLSSALAQLEKRWQDLKSFRATYSTRMAGVRAAGSRLPIEATGQLDVLKDKKVIKYRLTQEVSVLNPDGTTQSKTRKITLHDGLHTYVMTDLAGAKSILVMSPESEAGMMPVDAQSLLDNLREIGDIKLLPREIHDGVAAYVFEGAPLLPNDAPEATDAARMRLYVDEATGVPLRWVLLDTAGQPVAEGGYADIVLNPKLDPEQFVFEPPVGATIIDMRAPGAGQAAPQP